MASMPTPLMVISAMFVMTSIMTSAANVPLSLNGPRIPTEVVGGDRMRIPLKDTTSIEVILLILREKCKQWQNQGVSPLPSYCWRFQVADGGAALPRASLQSYFEQYSKDVSPGERQRDLQVARDQLGQSGVQGGHPLVPVPGRVMQ